MVSVAAVAAVYWAACSFLIHRSFHSNGWDLGLVNQVIWNSAHGHLFAYSFRDISYAGDHWQPFLLALVPLKWLGAGPEALLVTQAVVLAAAGLPLYAAARAFTQGRVAALVAGVYLIGLGASRAVSFDFHVEAFAPLLAFTALWSLTRRNLLIFAAAGLLILTLKEDVVLLTLALCWIAWAAFGERTAAGILASVAVVYALVATMVIIPHYRGDALNPFVERYGYLGSDTFAVLVNLVIRPDLVFPQLARIEAIEAVVLVLASAALLPLVVPRLLPALGVVTLIPLLSKESAQGSLDIHYFLVPSTVALMLAVFALRELERGSEPKTSLTSRIAGRRRWLAAFVLPIGLFFLVSPLPPSFATDWGRFDVNHHADVAESFVRDVPDGAFVSAQSPFVPHLSERTGIYQFPRVLDAQFVLLDEKRSVPTQDINAGYADCLRALPRLGFDEVRSQDGITLWQKRRPSESVPEAPVQCSGQH